MPGSSSDRPVGDVPMPLDDGFDTMVWPEAPVEQKSTDVPDEAMLESRKRQSDMSLDELETNIGQILCDIRGNETAWDDVNENLELPIQDVISARAEEMGHVREKGFQGGQESRVLRTDWQGANKYQAGRYGQVPRTREDLGTIALGGEGFQDKRRTGS